MGPQPRICCRPVPLNIDWVGVRGFGSVNCWLSLSPSLRFPRGFSVGCSVPAQLWKMKSFLLSVQNGSNGQVPAHWEGLGLRDRVLLCEKICSTSVQRVRKGHSPLQPTVWGRLCPRWIETGELLLASNTNRQMEWAIGSMEQKGPGMLFLITRGNF